ncbi:sporulation protein YqfD [Cytobacillus spongiae]|uniref:sporulation protein YqfD n=1 Tax=Cytobacillus spongiae TaxID=2901381 RepID=UPI001F1A434E|nr:sporulation protein YqfD [Cytobacillus spongiae]UII54919.1 sporulation protein YqfD [Cytobacillus spongiae]
MKNHWIEFYKGIVTVKASGRGTERFINQLTKHGILVWNVKRLGTHAITFKMKLADAKQIRSVARNSDCKIEFLQRLGLPFLMKRLLKNSGFLIGFTLFFMVIFLLSNMIWGIQINGANPATEYKISKELDKMGVKVGKLQFFVDDAESIQRKLTDQIEEITWVGIDLRGTTYHLQVVEKNEPEKLEYYSPRNLVAKKKAVIVQMFVEEGQPAVRINDHVKPGQLLVSGTIGTEDQPKIVPARGEILGETWYKTDVIFPLKTSFHVFNGNEKRRHFVKIGGLSIPIWGFGKNEFKQFETEENDKKLRFLKWELPISYISKTEREKEDVTKEYSKEEGLEMAKKLARTDIKNQVSDEAKIKGEKVLHHSIDNGKVKLSIHFQIIEDIAIEQPIIQGDSE